MKRLLSLILVLVTCLSLCACSQKDPEVELVTKTEVENKKSKPEPEFDPESEFESKVNAAVAVECLFTYADVKTAITTLTDISVSSDGTTYTGKGKVTIMDNYGDTYVGKVTAVYQFNAVSNTFTKSSLDIETPRKQ